MSYGPTGTQYISSSRHDDKDRNLPPFRVQTLPSIPIPVSQDIDQRVLTASNDSLRSSSPSSKQPDQRSSHPIDLKNLLNPIEGENHTNASRASSSLSLSRKTTIPSDSARFIVPALPLSRSSPCGQLSQEAPHSQTQNFKCLDDVNPAPPQPASQSNNPSTQNSPYNQASCTKPTITLPITSTGQTQYLLSNTFLLSGTASMPQKTFDAKPSEVPTRSITLQNQYQTERLKIPCDVQSTSKLANDKRKRNAGASQRFRQRRKHKDQETVETIKKLEARVRETTEERNCYLKERDHFRDQAIRSHKYIAPRPPSPRHRQYATLGGVSLA